MSGIKMEEMWAERIDDGRPNAFRMSILIFGELCGYSFSRRRRDLWFAGGTPVASFGGKGCVGRGLGGRISTTNVFALLL